MPESSSTRAARAAWAARLPALLAGLPRPPRKPAPTLPPHTTVTKLEPRAAAAAQRFRCGLHPSQAREGPPSPSASSAGALSDSDSFPSDDDDPSYPASASSGSSSSDEDWAEAEDWTEGGGSAAPSWQPQRKRQSAPRRASAPAPGKRLRRGDGAVVGAAGPPRRVARCTRREVVGAIDGVARGFVFDSRRALFHAGVHRGRRGEISGSGACGALSLLLSDASGGLVSDEGTSFVYSRRDDRAEQPEAEAAEEAAAGGHAWLRLSQSNGQPVRVVRASGLHSPFAPERGFRYDGCYSVVRNWESDEGAAADSDRGAPSSAARRTLCYEFAMSDSAGGTDAADTADAAEEASGHAERPLPWARPVRAAVEPRRRGAARPGAPPGRLERWIAAVRSARELGDHSRGYSRHVRAQPSWQLPDDLSDEAPWADSASRSAADASPALRKTRPARRAPPAPRAAPAATARPAPVVPLLRVQTLVDGLRRTPIARYGATSVLCHLCGLPTSSEATGRVRQPSGAVVDRPSRRALRCAECRAVFCVGCLRSLAAPEPAPGSDATALAAAAARAANLDDFFRRAPLRWACLLCTKRCACCCARSGSLNTAHERHCAAGWAAGPSPGQPAHGPTACAPMLPPPPRPPRLAPPLQQQQLPRPMRLQQPPARRAKRKPSAARVPASKAAGATTEIDAFLKRCRAQQAAREKQQQRAFARGRVAGREAERRLGAAEARRVPVERARQASPDRASLTGGSEAAARSPPKRRKLEPLPRRREQLDLLRDATLPPLPLPAGFQLAPLGHAAAEPAANDAAAAGLALAVSTLDVRAEGFRSELLFLVGALAQQINVLSRAESLQARRDRGLHSASARLTYDGGHFPHAG